MNADLYNHTILVRFIKMVHEAHVNTPQEDTFTFKLLYRLYIVGDYFMSISCN